MCARFMIFAFPRAYTSYLFNSFCGLHAIRGPYVVHRSNRDTAKGLKQIGLTTAKKNQTIFVYVLGNCH